MSEVLTREIALACPPERAFRAFTEHVDLWWPRSHRREAAARMAFVPGESGRLVQPFAQLYVTDAAHFLVHPAGRVGVRKIERFREWLREELEADRAFMPESAWEPTP